MKFDIVSGEDAYRVAYEGFKAAAESMTEQVLAHAKGRVYTDASVHKNYVAQRENALKKRPSRAQHLQLAPLRSAVRVEKVFDLLDAIHMVGFYQYYDDAGVELDGFHPRLERIWFTGTNLSRGRGEPGAGYRNVCWYLDREDGGLIEIDPGEYDLTAEDVERTRVRLAAERKALHGLKR